MTDVIDIIYSDIGRIWNLVVSSWVFAVPVMLMLCNFVLGILRNSYANDESNR